MKETQIDPPIFVSEQQGVLFSLSTVEQVIDYVRRIDSGEANWQSLRDAAFVAAAVPSDENLATLRLLAEQAFRTLR